MKKFNINERILSVIGRSAVQVKQELRILLRSKGRIQMSNKNFNELRNAEITDTREANSKQLKLIANYFGCAVDDLYTMEWKKYLSSIKLQQASIAA